MWETFVWFGPFENTHHIRAKATFTFHTNDVATPSIFWRFKDFYQQEVAFTLNACPGCFQIDQIKCWTIIFKQKYSSLSFNAWVHCTFYNCFDHLCIFTLLHIHFTITLCRRLRMRSITTSVLSALWIMYLPIRFVILLSINRVKIVQCFEYHCTDLRAMGHCDPNRITDLCLSFYLHPNIPDRFVGAKMNIYHFSFSISLLIKRRKGTSWILSNISHKKLGDIFEEFSFQTLEVFFFNISGWGVFHTSYKIENFETRLVCEKHLLQFFCLYSSLSWYLVLYFSYSTFWGVKRVSCKQGSCVRWKLAVKSFS